MGEKIGDENVVLSIHQIVAKPAEPSPQLRVAAYRAQGQGTDYQSKLAERLKRCWDAITSGHVFPDLTREESDQRCADLEAMAIGLSQNEICNESGSSQSIEVDRCTSTTAAPAITKRGIAD